MLIDKLIINDKWEEGKENNILNELYVIIWESWTLMTQNCNFAPFSKAQ